MSGYNLKQKRIDKQLNNSKNKNKKQNKKNNKVVVIIVHKKLINKQIKK